MTATGTARDEGSIKYFGERSQALGFPLTDLSTLDAALQPFADAVLARYGKIVNRLSFVEADTLVDPAWLEPLVHLDVGDTVTFTRRGINPERTLTGFVCGYEHRLTRDNWSTTIFTTTSTRSI